MPSLAMRRRQLAFAAISLIGLSFIALPVAPARAEVPTVVCGFDGDDVVNILPQPGPGVPPDLVVNGPCQVTTDSSAFKGTWKFRRVNIIDGGVLEFVEKKESETDFWAHGIVIENGGKVIAGRAAQAPAALPGNAESGNQQQPVLATASGRAFGELGGKLRIHLYGEDQSRGDPKIAGQGTPCRSQEFETGDNPCGIDDVAWKSNGSQKVMLANGLKDYFYQYDPLYVDTKTDEQGRQGYFGYKSIGLAYGGSLELYGAKGSLPPLAPDQREDPTDSGNSWVRLGATLIPSYKEDGKDIIVNGLKLDRIPGKDWAPAKWQPGDEIVVTTTDYLASHSEQLTIERLEGDLVFFRRSDCAAGQTTDGCPGARWRHQGTRYPLSNRLDKALGPDGQPRLTIDPKLVAEGVETRAAVALLTRSIRILSAGDNENETFAQATARNPSYAFGGHLVVRQGFRKMQVQGVEFKQLGQGGRKGHYPVHFHMARLVPNESWIKDSSINESMTRWIVVHSTQNLTIARNVGYLSIGHGFYLEDSTEIDNRFHSNIGIHARAAVDSDANPRRIPGILVANNRAGPDFPYLSDGLNPSVFWITNNWNDFIGNAAVGAGTCGACYWVVPSYSEQNGHHGMKWEGYAALQSNPSLSGATPMKSFYKNSCTSAMNAIMTVDGTAACNGVSGPPGGTSRDFLNIIKSTAPTTTEDLSYYPKFTSTPHATTCPVAATQDNPGLPTTYDCNNVQVCANGKDNCAVTVIDHFTTSFNWSAYNFSAVWLRQFWYLFDNSAITDTLSAGITFVSGGDYTKSSSPEGYWALASNSLFVGETQPDNPLAWSIGPVNAASGLRCQSNRGDTCVLRKDGMIILKSNWGVNQRFFNIYDGPNYQESNAYLDIKTRPCTQQNGCLWAATNLIGVRNDPAKGENGGCYAPNAAIAWKQPNGFYYPPAFHSTNLYFDNVDIRHYVIAPVFKPVGAGELPGLVNFGQGGSYLTDIQTAKMQYCYFPPNGFDTFTDIDRQTELNDDDGSLTGLARTISVNEDPFFNAPVETSECKSNVGVDPVLACNGQPTPKSVDSTAKTSPYDYVTTVIVPANCANGGCPSSVWDSNCGGPYCYGVPIFRQFLVGSKAKATGEWAHWAQSGCYIADGGVARAACRWPFLRMAGQNTWQRSNMTANYGSYYIDTSISEATQRNEKFTTSPEGRTINVFEAGKPYSLMFLFAKNTTKQTYQVYVGKDFRKDQDVRPVRGRILLNPTTFSPADNAGNWLTTEFADGLLTIKVDFANVKDLTPNQANGMCRPHGFCDTDITTGACGCSLKDTDPLVLANPGIKATCVRACGNWAVKDLDCPIGGCYAVSFTMGADFKADDIQRRPQPQEFPGPTVMSLAPGSGDRGWETLFSRTTTLPDGKAGGTCYYDKLPGTAECLSPP